MRKLAEALALVDRAHIFDDSSARRRLLRIREDGRDRHVADRPPALFTAAPPS